MTAAGFAGFRFSVESDGPQSLQGDWHGERIVVTAAAEGDQADALRTLAVLHQQWPNWIMRLRGAMAKKHGRTDAIKLEGITAYDDDYFEIEFCSPAVFGDSIALAVGSLTAGFEEIGTQSSC